MRTEALPAETGSTGYRVGTSQCCSPYPFIVFSYSHDLARDVLLVCREYPGSIAEIQHRLGYSRGNPKHKDQRAAITQIIYMFESLGLLRKNGHKFTLTARGEAHVIR